MRHFFSLRQCARDIVNCTTCILASIDDANPYNRMCCIFPLMTKATRERYLFQFLNEKSIDYFACNTGLVYVRPYGCMEYGITEGCVAYECMSMLHFAVTTQFR